ncbi:hypothetical protein FRC01_006875 [Tulasnella sp. 417]|nr:hypothetical protein FRC01_006875 [Tulasnella sp. 417]
MGGANASMMAKKISRQLENGRSAVGPLLDDLEAHDALARLEPVVPELSLEDITLLLSFDSFQQLFADDTALPSNEFITGFLQSDAPVESKGFVKYIRPARCADILLPSAKPRGAKIAFQGL